MSCGAPRDTFRRPRGEAQHAAVLLVPLASAVRLPASRSPTLPLQRVREGEASSVRGGVRVRPLDTMRENTDSWLLVDIDHNDSNSLRITIYRPYIEAQWVYGLPRSTVDMESVANMWTEGTRSNRKII